MSHTVYGLILSLATLGELLNHRSPADEAAFWLFGTGAVLFAAHAFSDTLARLVAADGEVGARGVMSIGRNDLAVSLGGFAMGATMLVAYAAGIESLLAMRLCLVAALAWLALTTWNALSHHRSAIRLGMTLGALCLAVVIVGLENAH